MLLLEHKVKNKHQLFQTTARFTKYPSEMIPVDPQAMQAEVFFKTFPHHFLSQVTMDRLKTNQAQSPLQALLHSGGFIINAVLQTTCDLPCTTNRSACKWVRLSCIIHSSLPMTCLD